VIGLFGGEPFLNFDLIRELDDYVAEYYPGLTFEVITNGTLIHNEIKA
jgi:sulfatase maturation enzyme AslB (radical SAM superfamily)